MRFLPHTNIRLLITTLLFCIPFVLALRAVPSASAAQPGEMLVSASGVLDTTRSQTIPLYSPGATNFRLEVSGGSAGDSIVMTLVDGSSTPPSWSVRSGEVIWGFGTVPTAGRLVLENRGSAALTYQLKAFARGVAPNITEEDSSWSGVVRGDGTQSAIQIAVAAAGIYRFTLGAAEGSYQLRVDNDTIRKTVVKANEPDAATDSVYYLAAGVHTLTLLQNSAAATTQWSVALAAAGASVDTLPVVESTKVLGGPSYPREEWIPIQVAAGERTNIKIEVSGGNADSLDIQLWSGNTAIYTSPLIFGGEISWGTSALAAGANALRVTTSAGNAQPLGYRVTISAIGQTPTSWAGVSYGQPSHAAGEANSAILLEFPVASLYQFNLSAGSGRYQLNLDDGHLQKTVVVSEATQFSAYVPAGTLPLKIVQDPAAALTSWTVDVTRIDQSADSLPYARRGVTLGGANNAFTEEWLPLQAASAAPVNLSMVVSGGTPTDSLVIELYNDTTLVYKADQVYSGELFWASSDVTAGANRLHILAAPANSGQLSYELSINAIADMPVSLTGVSLKQGISSVVRLNAPVAGVYDLVLTMTEGLGLVLVDSTSNPALAPQIASSSSRIRVPLTAGLHTFMLQQDSSAARTVWELTAALRKADVELALQTVTPDLLPGGAGGTLTLIGSGFDNNMQVEIVAADGTVTALGVVVVSATELAVEVPATLASGTYSLRLSSATGTLTMARAFSIGARSAGLTYIPFVLK